MPCKWACFGRLAQLGEHQLDKLGVTGSSPVPPIEKPAGNGGFLLLGDSRLDDRQVSGGKAAERSPLVTSLRCGGDLNLHAVHRGVEAGGAEWLR